MTHFQCGVAPWQFKCLCLHGACSQLHSDKTDARGQFPETALAIAKDSSFMASRDKSGAQAPEEWGLGGFLGARGQGSHPQQRASVYVYLVEKSFCLVPALLAQPFRNRKLKAPPFPFLNPAKGQTS